MPGAKLHHLVLLAFAVSVLFTYVVMNSVKLAKDVDESKSIDNNLEQQKSHFRATVKSRLDMMRQAAKSNSTSALEMYVIPQMSCPTMIRVGGIGDGGKWVCNPWLLPTKDCVVYSFGTNGDVSFETDLNRVTNGRCRFLSVDQGKQNPDLFKSFKGTFLKAKIVGSTTANGSSNEMSVKDIMKKFGDEKIDILKIDIEGYEFDALPPFFRDANISHRLTNVCQLLVEFHHEKSRMALQLWMDLFEELERRGFYMFAREANMFCPHCFEYAYIHEACLSEYGLSKESIFGTYFRDSA